MKFQNCFLQKREVYRRFGVLGSLQRRKLAEKPANQNKKMKLKRGDLIILNNHILAHGRTTFKVNNKKNMTAHTFWAYSCFCQRLCIIIPKAENDAATYYSFLIFTEGSSMTLTPLCKFIENV